MVIMDEPRRVTGVYRITAEFYDEEATAETLRYALEQDLIDAGYEVDVAVQGQEGKTGMIPEPMKDADELIAYDGAVLVEYNPMYLNKGDEWAFVDYVDFGTAHLILRHGEKVSYSMNGYGVSWRCWPGRKKRAADWRRA